MNMFSKNWIFYIALMMRLNCFTSSYLRKSNIGDPQRKSGYIHGDFIIGALVPVHENPLLHGNYQSLKCGIIREQHGIQRMEAAFYAIDKINENKNLLPGIKLGINIKDGCGSESITLHQTIDLINDPTAPEDNDLLVSNETCTQLELQFSPLIGIIGPFSSSTTITVQNLLKLFQIPQIGYSATSADLGDMNRYPYFLRTVPSDIFQTKLMWGLLRKFGWTYISFVYTDDNYGQSGMAIFRQNVSDHGICIANYKAVSSHASPETFDRVIYELNKDKKANVIVCYCDGTTITGILTAIKKANLTGRFTFIGSDSWGTKFYIVDSYKAEAAGSMTLSIDDGETDGFDDYFQGLNLKNNLRNPWFKEFWEFKFNCTVNPMKNTKLAECSGEENLEQNYEADSKISYVIKAIYAMAYALHDMQFDFCDNKSGPCEELLNFNTSTFMKYLLKVNFSYGAEHVTFDSNGEPWEVKFVN